MDVAKCRSCGAPIVWVVMRPSGKRMPLDAKPEKRITLDVIDPAVAEMTDTYVSHFSSCPNAAQHRKPKLPGVE
jgi:hypothetical protein